MSIISMVELLSPLADAIKGAQKDLEELRGLDAQVQSAKGALDTLKKSIQASQVSRAHYEEQVISAQKAEAQARQNAQKILDDARILASNMITDARKKAEETVQPIRNQIVAFRDELSHLTTERDNARKELAEITSKHSEVSTALKTMLEKFS